MTEDAAKAKSTDKELRNKLVAAQQRADEAETNFAEERSLKQQTFKQNAILEKIVSELKNSVANMTEDAAKAKSTDKELRNKLVSAQQRAGEAEIEKAELQQRYPKYNVFMSSVENFWSFCVCMFVAFISELYLLESTVHVVISYTTFYIDYHLLIIEIP